MKQFFKFLLASTLGVFIALFIITILMIGAMGTLASLTEKTVVLEPNSILKLEFNTSVAERSSGAPSDALEFLLNGAESSVGLNDVLACIKKASTDDNIKGIYFKATGVSLGFATAEEIRNALLDFKSSGKFILAYGESFSLGMYYLATAADKIYLTPSGDLTWQGMRAQVMYYKGLLEKLGVEVQIVRHGKFKSAVEPYLLDKMSAENKEQYARLLDNIWGHMVEEVASARGLSPDSLNIWADRLEFSSDEKALAKNMVDGLLYRDQMVKELMEKVSVSREKDLEFIGLGDYKGAPDPSVKKLERNKIAIVYAFGDVVSGNGGDGEVSSEGVSKALRQAREDSSIKAIVFRINSPGGSVLASEVIWREARLAAEAKPLIASFGDYAASGGYYIASPASAIVAQPTTLTGSIGVFWVAPMIGEAMKEKLGLTVDIYATNPSADAPSIYRPMTPVEREQVQRGVEKAYDIFLSHVSDGRGISKASVDSIGQGRVWNGMDAKELGLVDELGGIKEAVALAAQKANVENYRVTEFPKQKTTMEQLMELFDIESRVMQMRWGDLAGPYQKIKSLVEQRGAQARMEDEIVLY